MQGLCVDYTVHRFFSNHSIIYFLKLLTRHKENLALHSNWNAML